MIFNKFEGKQELDLETMEYEDNSIISCYGGGSSKGGGTPAPTPITAPTPPVEEASVELDDDIKSKARTGKSTLKVPLETSDSIGLNL